MAGKNDESAERSSKSNNSVSQSSSSKGGESDLSFNSESGSSALKSSINVQSVKSHDKHEETQDEDRSNEDSVGQGSNDDGIPTNISTQSSDETSRTPGSKLTASDATADDDDEENQAEPLDRQEGKKTLEKLMCVFKFLMFLKSLISICSLVSSILILTEIIALMIAIDYDFVGYTLSIYFLVFLLIMILGEIPKFEFEFVKAHLLGQLPVRGFIYVFIAVSVMEEHKYAKENKMMEFRDPQIASVFFSVINWAALFSGIAYFFMGTFKVEEEAIRQREKMVDVINRIQSSSDEDGDDAEDGDDDEDGDDAEDSDLSLGDSETTVAVLEDSSLEMAPVELEEEPTTVPRVPLHNFLRSFPLIAIIPTVLLLIEVFFMMCIIESYDFLEVFVRAYFLVIGIILILGEAVSILPEEDRLPNVRQGFLRMWYIRGLLYIFFVASVMQQHMNAKRDGSMVDTRIPKSDWDASAASAFWGIFNWFAFVIYFIYLVLGLKRMENTLEQLDMQYETKEGVYDDDGSFDF